MKFNEMKFRLHIFSVLSHTGWSTPGYSICIQCPSIAPPTSHCANNRLGADSGIKLSTVFTHCARRVWDLVKCEH